VAGFFREYFQDVIDSTGIKNKTQPFSENIFTSIYVMKKMRHNRFMPHRPPTAPTTPTASTTT
jgi:hypothetical protein